MLWLGRQISLINDAGWKCKKWPPDAKTGARCSYYAKPASESFRLLLFQSVDFRLLFHLHISLLLSLTFQSFLSTCTQVRHSVIWSFSLLHVLYCYSSVLWSCCAWSLTRYKTPSLSFQVLSTLHKKLCSSHSIFIFCFLYRQMPFLRLCILQCLCLGWGGLPSTGSYAYSCAHWPVLTQKRFQMVRDVRASSKSPFESVRNLDLQEKAQRSPVTLCHGILNTFSATGTWQ